MRFCDYIVFWMKHNALPTFDNQLRSKAGVRSKQSTKHRRYRSSKDRRLWKEFQQREKEYKQFVKDYGVDYL